MTEHSAFPESELPPEELHRTYKRCCYCSEAILRDASYCRWCESMQDLIRDDLGPIGEAIHGGDVAPLVEALGEAGR